MGWRGAPRRSLLVAACGALTACSLGPKTEQPATYDLGAPRSHAAAKPGIAAVLLVPEVSAPAWLERSTASSIASTTTTPRARSLRAEPLVGVARGAADRAPAQPFRGAAAKGIVTGADGVRADYMLRVELEDFSQSFDAPDSSRVALRARASLVNLASRSLVAQRAFAVEQAAPTPDAPGAVQALSAASEEFMESLLKWTEERLKAAGGR